MTETVGRFSIHVDKAYRFVLHALEGKKQGVKLMLGFTELKYKLVDMIKEWRELCSIIIKIS